MSTEEALEDVNPINWSDDVLAGNYRNQTIAFSQSESECEQVLIKK